MKQLAPSFLLATLLGGVPLCLPVMESQAADLGPQLEHQLMFRSGSIPADAPFAPRAIKHDRAKVYLIFDEVPRGEELSKLEQLGVRFRRLDGSSSPAHVGRIYGADLPWGLIPRLEHYPGLHRIETADRRTAPAMDLSMPEIEVDQVRELPQARTDGLSGRNQLIAAFDTSVDLFHPALFKPDGGMYSWLDVDGDGELSLGVDAVDLDGDGAKQESETLRLLENAEFDVQYGPLKDGFLDVDQDWVYADTDVDGQRDFGPDEGFGETDLAYGEPLFIVDDEDGDGLLSPSEKLVRLGTSKVQMALDGDSSLVTHYRGSNLLSLTPDLYPHGTSVAGILLGDVPGRLYAGVAPEAELLEVAYESAGVDLVSAMNFARLRGSDVMVYEFGNWSGEFLDGSSAIEEAVTSMADNGTPQVCPAGNIGQNNKHGFVEVAPGSEGMGIFFLDGQFSITATYVTALWRESAPELTFNLEFISEDSVSVNSLITAVDGQTVDNAQGDHVAAVTSTSDRDTRMMDLTLWREEDSAVALMNEGLYYLTITNDGEATASIELYIADDRTTWTGGATWTSSESPSPGAIADPSYSVASPGTADSCITVGSYATRQSDVLGDLSTFSSIGPRIDGRELLDVAAPGNYDIMSPTSSEATYFDASINAFPSYPAGGSWLFSGTSASAPHVAGAIALLKQLDSSLTHDETVNLIRNGALADSFTGEVPNDAWGMGKLRVRQSLLIGDSSPPSFTILADRDPAMASYLMITLIPSERLEGLPEVSSDTLTLGDVRIVGDDLYTISLPAPEPGSSFSITATGIDEAGNEGSSTEDFNLIGN